MTKIILNEFRCLRCERSFHSAQKDPRRCGKCKTPYWNIPRKNKSGGVR